MLVDILICLNIFTFKILPFLAIFLSWDISQSPHCRCCNLLLILLLHRHSPGLQNWHCCSQGSHGGACRCCSGWFEDLQQCLPAVPTRQLEGMGRAQASNISDYGVTSGHEVWLKAHGRASWWCWGWPEDLWQCLPASPTTKGEQEGLLKAQASGKKGLTTESRRKHPSH